MKWSTFLYKYLHPYRLMDEVTVSVWPYAEPFLDDLKPETFHILEKIFNLSAIIAIHYGFQLLNWLFFIHMVLLLGVSKQIFQLQRAKLRELETRKIVELGGDMADSEDKDHMEDEHFDFVKKDNSEGVVFDADRVEDFCKNNLKPSLDWLNRIVRTVWLNFRAFAKFKVLHDVWPKVKHKLEKSPLRTLEIHDFNIGDKPLRIINIECIDYDEKHMIIDVEIAYDGNANITITYSQESLNISIPVTLQKFSVSNVKVRIVFKNLKDTLPLVEGIQLFFLESPIVDWQTADAAKVVDLPGLDSLIKGMIDSQIIQRFVLPNRLTIPVQVPQKLKEKLQDMGLTVTDPDDASVVMPDPEGVVRVTVVKAENLRPTDLGFKHYSESKNLNPCKPNKFSCSEILPKKCTADPYVTASVGKESYQSEVESRTLDPEWNFSCEFVVEYYHKALVKLEIYDKDISLGVGTSDDLLGRITEKISRIRARKEMEGWYNCQIYQGRLHLKFEWTSLSKARPRSLSDAAALASNSTANEVPPVVPGAVCLFIGIMHAKETIRPTVFADICDDANDKKILEKKSLDAAAADVSWIFNEGKIFRVKNLNDRDLVLQIRVYDNVIGEFIGRRKFKIRGLMDERLDGYYKVHNPFESHKAIRSVALSLRTKIVFDQTEEEKTSEEELGSKAPHSQAESSPQPEKKII